MTVNEVIEAVLIKWAGRGYVEVEVVQDIAADISGEITIDVGPLP